MMNAQATREGSFGGRANTEQVEVEPGRWARVWTVREAARNAALSYGAVSTYNRRVEDCKVPLLVESGTV